MIALVPYIRETLRRHLNPKQAVILVEFDKLKRVGPMCAIEIGYAKSDELAGLPGASIRDTLQTHSDYG